MGNIFRVYVQQAYLDAIAVKVLGRLYDVVTICIASMDWLPFFDLSQLPNWVIAQTPTPSPTPRSSDLELLRTGV